MTRALRRGFRLSSINNVSARLLGFKIGRREEIMTRIFKNSLLGLFIAALTMLSGGQAQAEESATLAQAVQEALKHNPVLKAEAQAEKGQREAIGVSQAGYFPQVSANYQNSVGNGFMGFFLFPGYISYDFELLTVTLTENIYDFGRREEAVAKSRWGFRKSRQHLQAVTQKVIRNTEKAYYALLSAQHQEKAARQGLEDARRHLDIAQNLFQKGEGIRLDVTQAEVNLETARLNLIKVLEIRRNTQASLARLLGMNPQKHILNASDPAILPRLTPIDLHHDVEFALKTRPDLKEMDRSVGQMKAAVAQARDENLPRISGVAQYFLAQLPYGALPMPVVPNNSSFFSTYNVGGVVSIPIFEGGRLLHRMHEAHAKLRETEYRMDDARLRVEKDVVQAALKVETSRQNWLVTQQALERARENDRLVEQSFLVGGSRSLDVIDAQTALRTSREDAAKAKYTWASAVTDYQYALGSLKAPGIPGSGESR